MNISHPKTPRNHPLLRLYRAFLRTPLYGRTLAVLGFFALGIKQIVLVLSSSTMYQEPTWYGTL